MPERITCRPTLGRVLRCVALLSLAVVPAGCDDGARPDSDAALDAFHPDAAPDAGITGYAIAASTFGPGGINTNIGLTPSMGPDGRIRPDEVIEIPGLAVVFGTPGRGTFFVDSVAESTLTKYAVVDGRAEAQGVISFAALGFSTVERVSGVAFVSDTKALLLDSSTLQLVEWNPAEMVITRTTELADLAGRDTPTLGAFGSIVRDNMAFFLLGYSDSANDRVRPEAVVVAIDLEDSSVQVFADDACGDGVYGVLTQSGDIYVGSGPSNAAQEYLGRDGVGEGCLRRIPAGQLAFDPDFHPTIRSLTGQYGGGLMPGPDDTAFIRVLDEADARTEGTSRSVLIRPAWGWRQIDLANPIETVPVELDAGSGLFVDITIEDRTFVSLTAANFQSTLLLETTADPPARSIEVSGVVTSAVGY